MANITAKTSSNVFYKARCEAAKHNEQLSSREGAADIMSIDRGRLYRIESSIINPYPEEIRLMADLYNAPELENHYCTGMCPLGANIPKVSVETLDRISLRILHAFRKVDNAKELLVDIVADGVIDESEKPQLDKILGTLDVLTQVAQSLKIWVKKNL
ncbi:MAG: XRE family transcriptional regulator [Lachnospiraceae bacterium]|nr:XRE family transcriptional regulator [Lachnospiraceae bacterium]